MRSTAKASYARPGGKVARRRIRWKVSHYYQLVYYAGLCLDRWTCCKIPGELFWGGGAPGVAVVRMGGFLGSNDASLEIGTWAISFPSFCILWWPLR